MDSLKDLTNSINQNKDLSDTQIKICIDLLISEKVEVKDKEEFLTSLARKGESVNELASFISYFRQLSKNPHLDEFSDRSIDLCGTGGDRAGSFNISTFVSFILASSGIPVIKHGNRSISSKCGSADLLEAIGIPLESSDHHIKESVKKNNFTFLFAPSFHPAFKHIAPVRKKLAEKGIITIFNILGPMINPAQPSHQILGVYSKELVNKIADSLSKIKIKSGFVVHGCIDEKSDISGVDEITASGQNLICGIGESKNKWNTTVRPEQFCLKQSPISEIKGGDIKQNLKLMDEIFQNKAPLGLSSSIYMNASLGFLSTGKTKELGEGVELAKKLILDGKVKKWLEDLQHFNSR